MLDRETSRLVRYPVNDVHPCPMPEQRIKELELQLAAAGASIAALTATNLELTRGLADAEVRNKKIKRSARRDEGALRDQLASVQFRRG